MAYSTIPAAIDQLLITLNARAGLAGVRIEDGTPADLPTENERIFVDDATAVHREWAGMGQFTIDEEYTLLVRVEVFQPGSDRAACRDRLFAIVAEVEQAAVLDITLANVLKWGCKPGAMNPKCVPTDDGWVAFVTLNLECGARIRAM